jgi:tetratricopeptide (TPR) repeat protein
VLSLVRKRTALRAHSGTARPLAEPSARPGADEPAAKPVHALFGREAEMAELADLIAALTGGRGGSLLIEGEPGIGKTALVRAALAKAATPGCQVFWGAGDELGQALPLLPVLEGLRVREPSDDPRRQTIVRLLQGEADRGTDVPAVLAEHLLTLVAERCAERPTVLVLDDLQWADQASVALWRRLARMVPQIPLLLIGMMRPLPQRDDLRALRSAGDITRMKLAGLPEPAVTELISGMVGGRPDHRLIRLARGAAGNPLYITELIAALTRSSSVAVTGTGTATLTASSVPRSLSAAIADRLSFVSRPVREVLRAAALLGVEFTVQDLATVLDRPVTDLIPAIDEARAVGVLTEAGGGLGFRHPMIRAALYEEMPATVRAAWHRAAGKALAEAGAPVDRVARQLLRAVAGSPGTTELVDEWMLSWLTKAAGQLVGQAPQVAADLLRRAVAQPGTDPARRGFLLGRLADALFRAGDVAGAEQVASRALAHASEPDLLVDLHWTLAQCRMQAGKSAETLAVLRQVLTAPGISPRHRGRLLVLTARTHCTLGQIEQAAEPAARALTAAEETGDTWCHGWALHLQAIVAGMQGKMTAALELFGQALTVTEADPALTDLQLLVRINMAVTLGGLDRHTEAFAAAQRARQLAGQVGSAIRLGQAHSALGQLLFQYGQWDEALAEVDSLPDEVKEPGAVCSDLGIAAVICLHRDQVTEARGYLASAIPHADRLGTRVIGSLALARSLDCERSGALAGALAVLTAGLNDGADEDAEVLLADAVRLAVRTGDLGTAQALASRAVAAADGSGVPHQHGNAMYCRGLVDHDPARLLASAERYDAARRPLLRARALEAAADELASSGDRSQAQTARSRAVEAYTSLGAVSDVARLRAHALT